MEFFDTYREILRCELVYATGCTEPIAIAYALSLIHIYSGTKVKIGEEELTIVKQGDILAIVE